MGGPVEASYRADLSFPLTESLKDCHERTEWPQDRFLVSSDLRLSLRNLLVHRQSAMKLGLFRTDSVFRGRYDESDVLNFVERARLAGFSVAFEPAANISRAVAYQDTTVVYFLISGFVSGVNGARLNSIDNNELEGFQGDRQDLLLAMDRIICGWGFLKVASAVEGGHPLLRIVGHHLGRAEKNLTGYSSVRSKTTGRGRFQNR